VRYFDNCANFCLATTTQRYFNASIILSKAEKMAKTSKSNVLSQQRSHISSQNVKREAKVIWQPQTLHAQDSVTEIYRPMHLHNLQAGHVTPTKTAE